VLLFELIEFPLINQVLNSSNTVIKLIWWRN